MMEEDMTLFSPEILQGFLGGIGDGFMLTDLEGRVLYGNRAAKEILGYAEKLGERPLFSELCPLVDVVSGQPFPDPLAQAVTEERSVGLAKNIGILRDGQPVFLSATCSPIKAPDGSGRVLGGSVILRDVTRMRGLEMKVESDQRYMRAVFSAAGTGLCILNAEGEVVDINEAALSVMQTTYEECVGLQFGDAFRCENSLEHGCGHGKACRHCPVRNHIEAAAADDSFSGEFAMSMRNMRTHGALWLKLSVSQTTSLKGKQIIVSIVDESARREYEAQQERARKAAEEASRTKTRFLSNMSHELRTPLNGMLGMLQLAGREPLTGKQQVCLDNARQCAEDLLHLINDILDFSKLESGRMKIEQSGFDLPQLLQRICAIYRDLAESRGLAMELSDTGHLPRFIRGDALRLRQILHNLLSNALKFTTEGKISLTVCRGEREKQPVLECCVGDTGIGISEAEQKRLFHAFTQVDSSPTRRFGGSGLGLMIVQKLLDAMGGGIRVESAPGKGSRFCFWIPLIETDRADWEPRGQEVLMNPCPGLAAGGDGTADVSDLMAYCREKLKKGKEETP